jgi:hypothetical protein
MKEEFVMHVTDGGPVEAFCGFFDVVFSGSQENPADVEVRLTTAPDPTGGEGALRVRGGRVRGAMQEGKGN